MAQTDGSAEKTTKYSSTLEDYFHQIIKGQSLEIDVKDAYDILNYLSISLNELKPKLRTIFPFLLIHFIKAWPGWQRSTNYFNNGITFEKWFKKFKEYLSFKFNLLIKNEIEKISDDIEHLSIDNHFLFGIHNSTQTNDELGTSLSAYSVKIEGPPRFLNTVIFSDSVNDDIILREHRAKVEWSDKLTIRQLINWPNIEMEFKSKELHFKRTNNHDFQRYLTLQSCSLPCKEPDNDCIEEVDVIDELSTRKSFSLNLITEYCNYYISILQKKQKFLDMANNYIHQIEVILEDLILDLIDIDKNSIATNTTVLFKIGNSTYNRTKTTKNSESIKLSDIITPKTLLSFINFTAFEDSSSDPFPLLSQIEQDEKDQQLQDILPVITFGCTFCVRKFSNDTDLWSHLKNVHAMELPVMCFHCKKQFKIPTLTEHRWRHNCELHHS